MMVGPATVNEQKLVVITAFCRLAMWNMASIVFIISNVMINFYRVEDCNTNLLLLSPNIL